MTSQKTETSTVNIYIYIYLHMSMHKISFSMPAHSIYYIAATSHFTSSMYREMYICKKDRDTYSTPTTNNCASIWHAAPSLHHSSHCNHIVTSLQFVMLANLLWSVRLRLSVEIEELSGSCGPATLCRSLQRNAPWKYRLRRRSGKLSKRHCKARSLAESV